jgi:hypothetical protein
MHWEYPTSFLCRKYPNKFPEDVGRKIIRQAIETTFEIICKACLKAIVLGSNIFEAAETGANIIIQQSQIKFYLAFDIIWDSYDEDTLEYFLISQVQTEIAEQFRRIIKAMVIDIYWDIRLAKEEVKIANDSLKIILQNITEIPENSAFVKLVDAFKKVKNVKKFLEKNQKYITKLLSVTKFTSNIDLDISIALSTCFVNQTKLNMIIIAAQQMIMDIIKNPNVDFKVSEFKTCSLKGTFINFYVEEFTRMSDFFAPKIIPTTIVDPSQVEYGYVPLRGKFFTARNFTPRFSFDIETYSDSHIIWEFIRDLQD